MPHTPTVGESLRRDAAAAAPNLITGEFVDTTKGKLGVSVAGSNPRILTFDWTANADGDVEAKVNWPIVGTLLLLRHQPLLQTPTNEYTIRLHDELDMANGDILANQGASLPAVLTQVQWDKAIGFTTTWGTDGITTVQRGVPCVTSVFTLLIIGAVADVRCITKLFWRPDA